ncbi:ABC transporter permease [Acetomicrobium sp. S15 = DSM 107314]|uniref:ABC transporter permease n=1 Tax=Acetomicrobium sp. S15 = DSM 107314 TaxID=2529858 RepID=UPI0018E12F37|nr:ABC transporter permease [Acetomicrobium sp. S15 = DSM 107314]
MMGLLETAKISLRSLWANKMRSGLAILGVIIGVGAVIAMIAVGRGASLQIESHISSMGSNILIIVPGTTTSGGVRMGAGTQQSLSLDDAIAIEKECSAVSHVSPELSGVAQVVYGNRNWSTGVIGTTEGMMDVHNWSVSSGRFLTDQDVRSSTKVAVIGETVAYELFGNANPVGEIIRIKKVPFQVVGVLAPKGQSAFGSDQDDVIFVPVTTAQKRLFGTPFPRMVRRISVKARDAESIYLAQEQITALLRQRHRIGPNQDDDFTVRNLTQAMEAAQQSTQAMTLLLGAIASVSLLVGGIGIMNIMLVSVTERTREIGIRMAVGARPRDIRLQFLIEAFLLSVIGGIAGIALGTFLSQMLVLLFNWSTSISPSSILLAFGFSGFVGVFFGFYPAYKASLMDPIEALRYE